MKTMGDRHRLASDLGEQQKAMESSNEHGKQWKICVDSQTTQEMNQMDTRAMNSSMCRIKRK